MNLNRKELNNLRDNISENVSIDLVKQYINEYKLNILPTSPKTKSPAGNWKDYQNKYLSEQEIADKFKNIDNENVRIGIICGKISESLEVIDFDNKLGNIELIYNQFLTLPNVKTTVDRCPVETTQSGGFHVYYRADEIAGNKKLASCLIEKEDSKKSEDGKEHKDKYETIIETRGEGGFIVCAPSKGYTLINGSFADIPVLTIEERETLLSAARSFNQKTTLAKSTFKDSKKYEESPWGEFDQSDVGLAQAKELLKEKGWTIQYVSNDIEYWCRPGKSEGVSATFIENAFYVFTSSENANPFKHDTCYSPSQIYAYLKHGTESDDFKKSAKEFLSQGFGKLVIKKSDSNDIVAVEDFISEEYDFRLNMVTSKLEIKKKNESIYIDADDYAISSIHRAIQHTGLNFGYDRLNNLLNSDFVQRYDPFKEYFSELPTWDGYDYIKELAETVKLRNPNLNDYWYNNLRKFLIAMVACAVKPDITNETSIIFFGSQGEGKTKWLNRLVPNELNPQQYLYVGNINDDKDSKINLSTRLLINLDELGSFNRQEIGYLKSLFSMSTVSIREPYMRKSRNMIRRASFVGSIDREEFLNDLSGTRRFLTFSIAEVAYQHSVDMNKVYAQAYELFNQGERFYFDKAEIKTINEHNDEFRVRSMEEELLQGYFEKPQYTSTTEYMTTTEIAEVLSMYNTSYKPNNASIKKIGEILNLLGYERKGVKKDGVSKKCWAVHRIPQPSVLSGTYFKNVNAN